MPEKPSDIKAFVSDVSEFRPLTIFLLVRSLEGGGAERQLVLLARGLIERGHSVQVGVFYRRGNLIGELESEGIEIIDLGKKGRWDTAGFMVTVITALRRGRPDIIYSFLGGANIVASVVRPFIHRTSLVWSVRASDMDLTKYDWVHRFAYRLECALSKSADLIIANSLAGRDFAINHGFPAEKFAIIPNGIDTLRFRPDPQLRSEQRRRFGLEADHIAVGVLARLDAMKGHATFLRAAAVAAAKSSQLRFLCIGSGPEEYRLKDVTNELGIRNRVLFAGECDPAAALNALDIACSPSLTEGFSNAIAEAMSCGLPCVVTDVGESAAIVGDTGAVVPSRDPHSLARAILAEAARLDRHDPQEPRARVVENFSISAMVERTLDALYSRLSV